MTDQQVESEEAPNPRGYSNNLDALVIQLTERFGRFPSDNEVFRYIEGSEDARQRIWDNKGLPEALRG